MATMTRAAYAAMFGPTTGDRVRLGDTSLFAEVEHDHAVPGEECLTGAGKTVRDSMAVDSTLTEAAGACDMIINNVLVLDPVLGIVKGDLGIKHGRVVALGKAGNPAIMDGVDPRLVIGPSTKTLPAQGLIATPGAIDVHAHYISAQEVGHALSSGLTTMIGGGWPGTFAVDSGGIWNNVALLRALAAFPMNFGLFSKGSSHRPEAIAEQIRSGVIGVKIHEDLGAAPAAIDTCLAVADDLDFQVQLHTDSINETGFWETTRAAIAGRTIHMYHTEGAGGGHAPDIIRCNGEPNCLPSSTNPTNPYTVNTHDEHLDMVMLCHMLRPDIPEDVAFAESRVRPGTIAAEDILHDMGAIAMFGSDSQGMGRIAEVVPRCWQLASKMKDQRGRLAGERTRHGDNERIRRYLAKLTINPARTFGIAGHVGSLEPGKMADIVLWQPAFFGIKASLVIKGGLPVWAPMGDAAACLSINEPRVFRPKWGAHGDAPAAVSAVFVHPSAIDDDLAGRHGLRTPLVPLSGTRRLTKRDMLHNDACPDIRVDAQTFRVTIDGEEAWCEPVATLPLTRRYMLR